MICCLKQRRGQNSHLSKVILITTWHLFTVYPFHLCVEIALLRHGLDHVVEVGVVRVVVVVHEEDGVDLEFLYGCLHVLQVRILL
jgi:hypothetical protein